MSFSGGFQDGFGAVVVEPPPPPAGGGGGRYLPLLPRWRLYEPPAPPEPVRVAVTIRVAYRLSVRVVAVTFAPPPLRAGASLSKRREAEELEVLLALVAMGVVL